MLESYFEYTLARCSNSVIPRVCSLYKNKAELLEAAQKGFNGTDNILCQGLLINAAVIFTDENGYIKSNEFSFDGRKVFLRCTRNLAEMKLENHRRIDLDRERIFNTLIDLNWLFASKYIHIQRNKSSTICLLESPSSIRIGIKKALEVELYESAYYDKDRSEQYSSATKFGYLLFSGTHPDPEIRDYYARGYTGSDFKRLKEQAKECSVRKMALYYALTATAARAEEMRRKR